MSSLQVLNLLGCMQEAKEKLVRQLQGERECGTPCLFIRWALPHGHGSNHFHALISMVVEDEVGKSEENDQNSDFNCSEQEYSQAILH